MLLIIGDDAATEQNEESEYDEEYEESDESEEQPNPKQPSKVLKEKRNFPFDSESSLNMNEYCDKVSREEKEKKLEQKKTVK